MGIKTPDVFQENIRSFSASSGSANGGQNNGCLRQVYFQDLGLIDYKECWDYQERLMQEIIGQRVSKKNPDNKFLTSNFLLFCEHPHVYTLGKSGSEKNILFTDERLKEIHASFVKTNRGGDITYHGPGQVVGYPILDLENFFTDIARYMRSLEEVIILALADFGITAGRLTGSTGVWIEPSVPQRARKICAMGVRTSRWVTMHGFALNVNTDLNYFNYIIPCGISDKSVTSMEKELGRTVNAEEVKNKLKSFFSTVFDCNIVLPKRPLDANCE